MYKTYLENITWWSLRKNLFVVFPDCIRIYYITVNDSHELLKYGYIVSLPHISIMTKAEVSCTFVQYIQSWTRYREDDYVNIFIRFKRNNALPQESRTMLYSIWTVSFPSDSIWADTYIIRSLSSLPVWIWKPPKRNHQPHGQNQLLLYRIRYFPYYFGVLLQSNLNYRFCRITYTFLHGSWSHEFPRWTLSTISLVRKIKDKRKTFLFSSGFFYVNMRWNFTPFSNSFNRELS